MDGCKFVRNSREPIHSASNSSGSRAIAPLEGSGGPFIHDYGTPRAPHPCSSNENLPRDYETRSFKRREWAFQLHLMEKHVHLVQWESVREARQEFCVDSAEQLACILREVPLSDAQEKQNYARLSAFIAEAEPDLKRAASNTIGDLLLVLNVFSKIHATGLFGSTLSFCNIGRAGLLPHRSERTLRSHVARLVQLGAMEKFRLKRPCSASDIRRHQAKGETTPKALYDTSFISLAPRMLLDGDCEETETADRLSKQRDCDRYAGKRGYDKVMNRRKMAIVEVTFPQYPTNSRILSEELARRKSRAPGKDGLSIWSQFSKSRFSKSDAQIPLLKCAETLSAQQKQTRKNIPIIKNIPRSSDILSDIKKPQRTSVQWFNGSAVDQRERLDEILSLLGVEKLRPGQLTAIERGKVGDLFLRCPPGFGKSLIFHVLGLLESDGVSLVIAPLRALMRDQVRKLQSRGISSVYLGSQVWNGKTLSHQKFIFCSPEKLRSRKLLESLQDLNITQIVVDEAHCLLEWNDFRPEFGRLKDLRVNFPTARIVAATATATDLDRARIMEILNMEASASMFDREQVGKKPHIQSIRLSDFAAKKRWLAEEMNIPREHRSLVFCTTRRDSEIVSQYLRREGHTSVCYHGGQSQSDREKSEKAFWSDPQAIMVATEAYGLGVDPPAISRLVHFSPPSSVSLLVQQLGRAGRRGESVESSVLSSSADYIRLQRNYLKKDDPRYLLHLEVFDWIKSGSCRHSSLQRHFGRTMNGPCGRCDNCEGNGIFSDGSEGS